MDFLETEFWGNEVMEYAISSAIIIVGVLLIFIIKNIVFKKLERRTLVTKNKFDDLLVHIMGKTLIPALYYGIIYVSLQNLHLNESFFKFVRISGVVILTILGVRFVITIINYALLTFWMQRVEDENKIRSVKAIMPMTKVMIYGIGIFFILDNLGFKIATLVAGLGIGGVAVALAGQAILADLFSYFSILFDRPFELGDFIIVDTHMGTIEHIGVKTTRIRSLSGEQLVMSNSDLTNSRVKNYKRMEERRVLFKLGVTYQTKPEHLKEIPQIIKSLLEKTEDTRFDRSHFSGYGDFSLNFETVYYVYGADYNKYMDIHQSINLQIFEAFKSKGIEFAYPTQTVFIDK